MALTQIDRELIDHCLQRRPAAWQAFAERFVGLFVCVIRHTADARSHALNEADIDDIAGEIFTAIVANDFKLLRHFRGKSSLATYLTVVARRITIHELNERRKKNKPPQPLRENQQNPAREQMLVEKQDLIEHLISQLPVQEAQIVQAFHLDGKSYQEIARQFGIPENSVGPVLSRARDRLRQAGLAAG